MPSIVRTPYPTGPIAVLYFYVCALCHRRVIRDIPAVVGDCPYCHGGCTLLRRQP